MLRHPWFPTGWAQAACFDAEAAVLARLALRGEEPGPFGAHFAHLAGAFYAWLFALIR